MAIAYDTSTDGGEVSGTSLSWSHTCTGSDRILFVGMLSSDSAPNAVTYNGTNMTLVDSARLSTPYYSLMYMLVNPSSGANNVSITIDSGFVHGCSVSYTGAAQSGQPDASTGGVTSAATSVTGTLTTVADNSWTVMMGIQQNGTAKTAGAGTTVRLSITGNQQYAADSNAAITPAGSTSLIVNSGSAVWAYSMASFSPAGASSSVKTVDGLANASVSTIQGLARASVKTVQGLA
jgi:hypothetical protein